MSNERKAQAFEFLARIENVTKKNISPDYTSEHIFMHAVEELGEYAVAKRVEYGHKNKKLKETAMSEAVDLAICALALVFSNGGTIRDVCEIGEKKLNKWENRLEEAK